METMTIAKPQLKPAHLWAELSAASAACDHGNTMGLHGQVVCVWCRAVIRQMTPEERAADVTWQTVVDPKAAAAARRLLQAAD